MSDEREERPGYVIGPTSEGPDVDETGATPVSGSVRSDDQIATDIRARLEASSLARHALDVRVQQRVVTLTGAVPDEPARHQAEQIAESVAGVHEVRSALSVARKDSAA